MLHIHHIKDKRLSSRKNSDIANVKQIETMIRFNRGAITQDVRDEYARLLDNDPTDDDIAQFIRDQYARLNLDRDQILQIF